MSCLCGCNQPTTIATRTRNGNVRGKPTRYLPGHNRLGPPTFNYLEEDRGYETPCWIWQGAIRRDGYGSHSGSGPRVYAHIAIWEWFNGTCPSGLELDHRCVQKLCVNPSHLEPVTHFENVIRGPSAKLTWDQVREIRAASDLSLQALATRYGVSKGNINFIRQGKTWIE